MIKIKEDQGIIKVKKKKRFYLETIITGKEG